MRSAIHDGQKRVFFLPHGSQRHEELSEWPETWQGNRLRDSTFIRDSFTVLIDIVTSQIVSKFGTKI